MKPPEFIEGTHFYMNAEGYMVLTAKYHLEKGYCCGMGCLHCPYDFENVPEPRKSDLLNKRNSRNEKN